MLLRLATCVQEGSKGLARRQQEIKKNCRLGGPRRQEDAFVICRSL